jgi:hypothetical protein
VLEANSRRIFLSELRPPDEYTLDQAIATTFSLDLLSLLMAPLSMVLFECKCQEDALKDPIAILEALRRVSGRFSVFCQQGRISVPQNDTPLFRYLEKAVVEVKPKDSQGVFHAKTWLLRFTSKDRPVFYRFLCLSKNLTFDRSWDTVLTLEGELQDRAVGYSRNKPLGEFIEALPELALTKLTEDTKGNVTILADEVRRVDFNLPEDFDDIEFLPIGIPGKKRKLKWGRPSRTLLVSPFLAEDPIRNLSESGNDNILISREESLDELPEQLIQDIEKNCQIYVMDVAAEKPEEMGDEEKFPSPDLSDLSGLHAKLVIFEEGWNVFVLSGSANATRKAWSGDNIEFMTQITGRRSKVGIDNFLGKESEHQSFYSMLRPYKRTVKTTETALSKQLETILENARQTISAAGIKGQITHNPEKGYTITLKAKAAFAFGKDSVLGTCYPISLPANNARDLAPLQKGEPLSFIDLSPVALSTFFAFHLEAQLQKEKAGISFVLSPPVEGMPMDRDKLIMKSIISDKDHFVRYLLFLLSEDPHCGAADNLYLSLFQEKGGANAGHLFLPLQLLEEMVRAYSRDKEKLDRVARLVDDLKQSGETQPILPEGFDQVWEAFLALRNEEKRFAP